MKSNSLKSRKGKGFLAQGSLILVLLVICIALAIARPSFLTYQNLFNLLRSCSVMGIVSIGMTFVIITGGIDLSVGSVVGFSSVLCGVFMKEMGFSIPVSLMLAILFSLAVGALNGILVYKGKIPAFIATLGSMQMFRGMAMLISNGRTLPGMPAEFTAFAQAKVFGLPSLFIVWIVVIVVAAYLLKWTRFGRNVYSIGSNMESARLSGVKLGSTICRTYMLNALCAAIAGILLTARITSAQPSAGEGYEMEAIAAAVIGGASLSGAEGSVGGTVIGSVIMAVLTNGGNLLGINSFVMSIIIGALVVIAVLIEKNKKPSLA